MRSSVHGALVPFLALVTIIGAGTAAQAAAGSQATPAKHDRAALTRYLQEHRSMEAQPAPNAGSQQRSAAIAPASVSHIDGPALVYTGSATAGRNTPGAKDLTTGATIAISGQANLPTGCLLEPRLSPDGNTYVMVRFTSTLCEGANQIVTFTLSGTLTTLTNAPANAWFDIPNWSADGTKILFTQVQDNSLGEFVSSHLSTVPAAGGPVSPVGGGGLNAFDGVYSHDGTQIAFAGDFSSSTANYLSTMNADGTGQFNLTQTELSPFSPSFPAWSPDGTKLSYQYDKKVGTFHNFGLAVVNGDNTGNHTLSVTNPTNTDAFVSTWSDDGTEIFYDAMQVNTSTGQVLAFGSIFATNAGGGFRTTVRAATATEAFYDPFFVGPGPSPASKSSFTPLMTPTRVQALTTVPSGGHIDVQVVGGTSPAPVGATAVTLNLTGVKATAGTHLTVFPTPASGNAVPLVSNLNLAAGQTAAVAVQVSVPAAGLNAGMIRIVNSAGSTGVIVDLNGYFTSGSGGPNQAGFFPLVVPDRVLSGTEIPADSSVDVSVLGDAPANATAVVLNLTATKPTAGTFESVVPTPRAGVPTVSNLNLPAGRTRANLVTVPIGAGSMVTVYNSQGVTKTYVDVLGYYSTDPGHLSFYPLDPTRVLDTRHGTNTSGGSTSPIGANTTITVPLRQTTTTSSAIVTVPPTAQAVVMNVTAVQPSASTYLTVFASDASPPVTSNLNAAAGTTVPNLVISALGGTGALRIFNKVGNTPVVADLAGYYAP
jgi:hypothetical protein